MNEKRIIKEFIASVSWADAGYIETWQDCIFLLLDDLDLLFLPCHWQEFEVLQQEVSRLAVAFEKKPTLLIWGNPDAATIEKIVRQCGEVVAWFVDPEADIIRNQFLKHAMDGIDWERSLVEILTHGQDAKAVMEWD